MLCILVGNILICTRGEVHRLFGLLLLVGTILENPRHPVEGANGVSNVGLEMKAQFVHRHGQLVGVSVLNQARRRVLCRRTHHLSNGLRCKIVLGFNPWHRCCLVFPAQGKNACRSTDQIARILAVSNVRHRFQGKLVFNCRELLVRIRNIENCIGAHPVNLLDRDVKERCPEGVNETGAQEFQRPEARIIRMPQSNGIGQRFQDVGA